MKKIDPNTISTLVLDIDGTISNEGERISTETIRILANICQKYHLDLIFLTGGAWCLIKYILDELHNICGEISFVKGVLSELGSKFINPRGNEIWGEYLSIDQKSLIINQIHKDDMFMFHGEKYGYYLYSNKDYIRSSWESKFEKYGKHILYINSDDYNFLINLLVLDHKVSVVSTSARVKFNSSFQTSFNTKHKLWEVSKFQAKKNGLIKYCDLNNISPKNILFSGNEVSDLNEFDLYPGKSVYIGDKIYDKSINYSVKDSKEFIDLLQKIFPID